MNRSIFRAGTELTTNLLYKVLGKTQERLATNLCCEKQVMHIHCYSFTVNAATYEEPSQNLSRGSGQHKIRRTTDDITVPDATQSSRKAPLMQCRSQALAMCSWFAPHLYE